MRSSTPSSSGAASASLSSTSASVFESTILIRLASPSAVAVPAVPSSVWLPHLNRSYHSQIWICFLTLDQKSSHIKGDGRTIQRN
mmetsp:Transcript_41235/g.44771  ORF Transcript_41235/g.44771 Transcript_41235/m.44771 type:complete len:85 (-) Transcript_41235:125-379(-)